MEYQTVHDILINQHQLQTTSNLLVKSGSPKFFIFHFYLQSHAKHTRIIGYCFNQPVKGSKHHNLKVEKERHVKKRRLALNAILVVNYRNNYRYRFFTA